MTDANPSRRSVFTSRLELLFLGIGLMIVSIVYRVELAALDPAKWATISAWILLLVGISIAQQLDGRFEQMLRRLSNRQAISLSPAKFEEFLDRLGDRARLAAVIGGLLLPAILLAAYAWVDSGRAWGSMAPSERAWLLGEITLESISALIAGRYVGRGVFYGLLGKQMTHDGVRLNMIFGHSDHAAGLRPIGDFYFFQAMVTALPVVFFAFWVLMMPVWSALWPDTDPTFGLRWKNIYLGFFFIAMSVEMVAFALPLWFFHQEMVRQKLRLMPRADELSAELSLLQRDRTKQRSMRADTPEPAQLVEQIELIESLPTWPLAPDVRNRFAWGNLAFLAPPAAKMSQTVMEAFSVDMK